MTSQLSRRRFLAISAAAIAHPAAASPVIWQGLAMGAEVSLAIHAPQALAEQAIATTRKGLRRIEKLFSLYDPASALSRLNRTGVLIPAPAFRELAEICGRMHEATGGVFDPTIQPLWRALAHGGDLPAESMNIGWHQVETGPVIRLAPGQQVTLNGIAQGYATDLIRAALADLGLQQVLVNMGEYAALGGPFRLGIADPGRGVFATRELTNRAIATSSPGALLLSGHSHILDPALSREPLWSTVSVEAQSAAVADACSTAFVLMTTPEIEASLALMPAGTVATTCTAEGEVFRISARARL